MGSDGIVWPAEEKNFSVRLFQFYLCLQWNDCKAAKLSLFAPKSTTQTQMLMRIFTKQVMMSLFACALSICVIAQDSSSKKDDKKKEEKKTEAKKEDTKKDAGGKDSKAKGPKDNQNQTEFMKPDMEATDYNFYQRKAVSTPLHPRMDLDSAVYQKGGKREKQQKAFIDHKYYYPAKPKDQWELGVNIGYAFVKGDVRVDPNPLGNFGAGLTVRKSLGYVASLRLGYNFKMMTGKNNVLDQNIKNNVILNRGTTNYFSSPTLAKGNLEVPGIEGRGFFVYNYRTWMHEVSLDLVLNIGNIRFHRERNMLNFYGFLGPSLIFTKTAYNALDENGQLYDFSQAIEAGINPDLSQKERRKAVSEATKAKLDKTHETVVGKYTNGAGATVGKAGYVVAPNLSAGVGMGIHVTKFMTISLEQKIGITGTDMLDGYQFSQDGYGGYTPQYDLLSYTSIHLLFHLGKKRVEPLWWMNPNDYTYRRLGELDPDKLMKDALKDDDGDGVPNRLDKEPNTPKDTPVDTHGVTLDSDKDGVDDGKDKEPFSAPGYPVDSFGVAQIPPNPCCDTTRFGNNGPDGMNGKGNGSLDCAKIELPGLYFGGDKYYVEPQYEGNLHQIATRMQSCPDMKLVVTGNAEERNDQKYNEQLGWNRSNSAVDYLVEKYGISRDRFIVKYAGGKKATTGKTDYERQKTRKVEFRYANEGETGESNPPAPHPGLKAGTNK